MLLTLLFSSQLFADCPEFALHGDWTVFYKDNAAPDSVLAPDSGIEIRYNKGHDQFSVKLTDTNWKERKNSWTHTCVKNKVVLSGTIEKKTGSNSLSMEMSRVTEVSDLLPRSSGVTKLDQINIRFPQHQAHHGAEGAPIAQTGDSYPSADPGHAHADR